MIPDPQPPTPAPPPPTPPSPPAPAGRNSRSASPNNASRRRRAGPLGAGRLSVGRPARAGRPGWRWHRCPTVTATPASVHAAGQVLDVETDHGALDDRPSAQPGDPRRAVSQPGVEPVPGPGGGRAIEAGLGQGRRIGSVPGDRITEDELAAVAGWAAAGARTRTALGLATHRTAPHAACPALWADDATFEAHPGTGHLP